MAAGADAGAVAPGALREAVRAVLRKVESLDDATDEHVRAAAEQALGLAKGALDSRQAEVDETMDDWLVSDEAELVQAKQLRQQRQAPMEQQPAVVASAEPVPETQPVPHAAAPEVPAAPSPQAEALPQAQQAAPPRSPQQEFAAAIGSQLPGASAGASAGAATDIGSGRRAGLDDGSAPMFGSAEFLGSKSATKRRRPAARTKPSTSRAGGSASAVRPSSVAQRRRTSGFIVDDDDFEERDAAGEEEDEEDEDYDCATTPEESDDDGLGLDDEGDDGGVPAKRKAKKPKKTTQTVRASKSAASTWSKPRAPASSAGAATLAATPMPGGAGNVALAAATAPLPVDAPLDERVVAVLGAAAAPMSAAELARKVSSKKSEVNSILYKMMSQRKVVKHAGGGGAPTWCVPGGPSVAAAAAAPGADLPAAIQAPTGGGQSAHPLAGGVSTAGLESSGREPPPEMDGDTNIADLGRLRFLRVRTYGGKPLADIREFYDKEGKLAPGRRGVSLTAPRWEALRANVEQIDAAVAAPTAEDNVVCQLDAKFRVSVRTYNSKLLVDIRETYEKDGQTLPGKRGIALSPEQWAVVRDSMDAVDQAIAKL